MAEVMIKGDNAVDLGARQIERVGDQGHALIRDVADLVLDAAQDQEQRPGLVLEFQGY